MVPTVRFVFLFSFLVLALTLGRVPAYGEEAVPAAVHAYSNFSSGGQSISQIAEIAKDQNVRVVIMTDHLSERYEYGFGMIKKVMEWPSIQKIGLQQYLNEIKKVNENHPDLLFIDGAAVIPFYYWSGNPWQKNLVLNDRAVDISVLGLREAEKYKNLPTVQNKRLLADPYKRPASKEPYQKFIDAAAEAGGLVIWSHPNTEEKIVSRNFLWGIDLILHTAPYRDALVSTTNYNAFGVVSVELSQIMNPDFETALTPGAEWDRILRQYCRGTKTKPVWAIGESGFNGKAGGIQNLDSILNMVMAPEKSQEAVLNALSAGNFYVIIPNTHQKRLVLGEYAVLDRTSGQKAASGETLRSEGVPILRLNAKFSDASSETLRIVVLRNGSMIQNLTKTVPFTLDYEDWENTNPGKSYYRVIAYSEETPARLLTNPIFVERQ